jgi:ABC-type transport system involved in cytochrome bd biosynthesis fused ATPase/permease subunit
MFKKGFGRKSSRGSFDDIPLPTPQTSSQNLNALQTPMQFTPQTMSASVPIETRLQQKTDLLDELRKTLPLDVRVPTIIVVGGKGSGKSSVLETLTGVPFPRGPNGVTRRAVKTMITADPTATG